MDAQLHQAITDRLDRDFQFKRHGEWLQQGRCPSCGKKELYTHAEHPWVLRCNRINHCGFEDHVKELYNDLFESWSDRFPTQPENPSATADAYMKEARGFSLDMVRGWYTQDSYFDHDKNIGSATVRFALPGIGYWERIIDRPHRFGKRKATFRGSYGGTWWQPPTLAFGDIEELWIVEGIFDAIALLHRGMAAVSTLTTNNYPSTALDALLLQLNGRPRPRLVFGFDGDKAGRSFTKKYVKRAREEGWDAVAAQIPQKGKKKQDWNDLHLVDRLQEKHVKEYRYHGDLLTAASASERAGLMYMWNGWNTFPFDFDNRMYWFKLDLEKFGKTKDEVKEKNPDLTDEEVRERALLESGNVSEIANCLPTPLYFQSNTITDESWYYFRVDFPHDGPAVKNTLTGGQLSSASEFKKRLLSMAPGAVWTGNAQQLDRLLSRWTYNIKSVQTIDYIGYSKEHSCYVWGDIAIQAGKVVPLNEEDFFDLGKLSIKTLSQSVALRLNTDDKDFHTEWLAYLWRCFGARGIVALAYWFGSLFAEQIRDRQKSYPFLEIVGEAGAGKSTLIEFLWKLCGRSDYEGFDPAKATTAARARNFAQVANLPVVLIESDRDSADSAQGRPAKNFDWDELKTAYNGRSVRSRGMKNGGNETYEPPFRGAIVISQNATVAASDAVMQRICHLYFERAGHTEASKQAAGKLETASMDSLSGFLVNACKAEEQVMHALDTYTPQHEQHLLSLPAVRHFRIAKNHAQLMSLVDALSLVVPLSEEQHNAAYKQIEDMAAERQQTINADHPLVAEFWEIFEFLDGSGDDEDGQPVLNHSRDSNVIAINLNHFLEVATDRKQKVPPLADLKRVLKTSRSRKFVDIKAVNSSINAHYNANTHGAKKPSTLKCWVFQA
ncbi:toprim domain-containing protein [Chromobacterium alkanivorans]|uniref:toprim domain-containing protein n=1 Tax=Chromobacterium alkanivorans TaxID=1071719 RepID=UPI00196770A5|nr:toprim domain-containing protein [Chromobacterium alkanivorans]MBN3005604.1 toprim domain-containing protein [Chromobacterium alkanivorans]